QIAGAVPLIPRWALGNWWSRYWEYTQDELQALMTEFRAHETPLSVCVVDMDWHVIDVGDYQGEVKGFHPGWTGYTWNKEFFPDPDSFIRWLHEQGLKTALNLHPADGVLPHEAAYRQMAERMGVDPDSKEPIRFDIASPDFANAYLEILHHPEEERGVDFWWMDWQQERTSDLPGLDPLWWLNHLHFYDLGRDGKRPFVFSRWGGLGNHRYPIGFSGDAFVNWDSLAFQPKFTATAANVGYGWWSHDIGGHMFGVEDRELFTRWVQFGVFSPILRLHSTKNAFHERRPWGYDAEVFQVTREAMQLRHALIPYTYSMAWHNHTRHRALVLPMYHDYPEADEAYRAAQQYTFGTELVAAPFTSPAHPETRLARQEIWLPDGDWTHFFTGEYFQGGQKMAVYGHLSDIPVFAKAGAIVPMGPKPAWGGLENPVELHLYVFAGADGRFTLYEDDGETTAYQNGAFALTEIVQSWQENRLEITLQPPTGDLTQSPAERTVHVLVHGIREPEVIALVIDDMDSEVTVEYDGDREALTLDGIRLGREAGLHITLATGHDTLLSRRDRTEETVIDLLHAFRLEAQTKQGIADYLPKARHNPALLDEFRPNLTETQLRALVDVIVRDA
ncbi:MAG: TIM-barrel domain-containing protein, partial [Anaerolineae bacterium]